MKDNVPELRLAVKAVIDRLLQMRQLWDDAAESYFDPPRFGLALQNCIMTSRTVTFILQANKTKIPDFDKWYADHVARWNADPVMQWAKTARNLIEKQGDLQTYSEVRAEIIAGYLRGPDTAWMPAFLFQTPQAIWRSVPHKFQIPHILENGTLLIERRWVDSQLQNMEVLEALAHVYKEFCATIADLLVTNNIEVPPELDRSRPDPMGELAMNRAVYLSMADGSITGHRFFQKTVEVPSGSLRKKLAKRYGQKHSWERLRTAKTLREVGDAYFERAKVVTSRDGIHYSFVFLLRGVDVIQMIRADHSSRAMRYVLMRDLAKLAHIAKADGVMYLGETWIAFGEDLPSSGFAADAKKRGEAIMLSAANAQGEHFQLTCEIKRKRAGSLKVGTSNNPMI